MDNVLSNADNEILINIVQKVARRIPTLDARNNDSLDFHDISVWELREMLTLAYIAGQQKRG